MNLPRSAATAPSWNRAATVLRGWSSSRCRPRVEATDQFVLLNEKLRALTQEIIQRKKAEMQRDALLLSERAARVEAEHNSRVKDEFLATLSHELRTPLNAIMGWADLIRNNTLRDEASLRRGLEVIDRNARAQLRLVEDLLDISHIISGKVRLDVQRVDLIKVVEAAVETVRPAAEAREIRLQITLDSQTPTLAGDPNRLQQIVWNLLANAIKFTPKNGRVQVMLARVNSHVELTISDDGRGIDPAFLPHVFDRFRQQDASSTRPVGGLGLGLAIVKELVELHGGSVAAGPVAGRAWARPSPYPCRSRGTGNRRCIRLPAHPCATQAMSNAAADAALDGLLILVVDDDPDAGELVRRVLEARGAGVTVAASAEEALERLAATRPDLVISDIGMPGEDGYGFMRRMRQLPEEEGGRIPAIALTAFAGSVDRTRTLLAGFQMHLAKPTEPQELIAAIASLTGRLDS